MERKVFVCGILLAMAFLLSVLITLPASGEDPGKVRVLIGFKAMPSLAEQDTVRVLGGEIRYSFRVVFVITAEVPEAAIELLRALPFVKYVEKDVEVKAIEQTLPWGVDRVDADLAHAYNKGAGVKVSIIDTGIDLDHPDLVDNIKGDVTFVDGTTSGDDDHGHGTYCAGIVAALDNDTGVVGVAPEALLYAVKVLDSEGRGWVSDVIAGIQWAVDNGTQVVSMSLGGSSHSSALEEACDSAYASGVLLVAAAGNEYGGSVLYPAAYPSVVGVSATDQADDIAAFSSVGPEVELCAPGVDIYSTYQGGIYETLSGTSAACPHVSGVAALVWADQPILTNTDVRLRLRQAAEDLGDLGKDDYYGYGLVDAYQATTVVSVATWGRIKSLFESKWYVR